MKHSDLLIDAKAMLGEGPSWDEEKRLLYWVDIPNFNVHIYNPADNSNRVIHTSQYVSAVVPRRSGGLIVTMHHGIFSMDPETGELTPIVNPEAEKLNNRFNDGKCDPVGRLWAGTMAIDESPESGALYCLDRDLSIRKMLNNISISNGLAWDEGKERMYYIDTPTKGVYAFDFELNSGNINNKRVVINFRDEEGFPDGMNIDNEGMLWIAHWGGAKVTRWDPHKGKKIDTVLVAAPRVTSCVFGGENHDELYITTARIGMSEKELEIYPNAGGVFKVKPGVRGVKTYAFHG